MANWLAFETSSPSLSVAVCGGKGKIHESSLSGFFEHAENLMPMITRLLRKAGLKLHEIDRLLIGQGPGSFTGLRIGFATLKGLRTGCRADCFGASSLDVIAEGLAARPERDLHVCLDARRGKFYARTYRKIRGRWHATGKTGALPFEILREKILPGSLIAGDALVRHRDLFEEVKKDKKIHLAPEKFWYPKASGLVHLSLRGKVKKLSKLKDFLPLYVRASEAEERKKENAPNR